MPTQRQRSSSRHSHSSRRGGSPSRRSSSNHDHDNPVLENAYIAADYIRKILDPTQDEDGVKTYPINDFALHLICGLPFNQGDTVELVTRSEHISIVVKLLRAGDNGKHLREFAFDKEKKALKLKVLTGPELGMVSQTEIIEVLIYRPNDIRVESALDIGYGEVITASSQYDYVETLGLSHSIKLLAGDHNNFKRSNGSKEISPALKTLCDIFYHMMDKSVMRRHLAAYADEELRKGRESSPERGGPSSELLEQEDHIMAHRLRSLAYVGGDINVLTQSFFDKLYDYYKQNAIGSKDPYHAQKFHDHAKAKVDFFLQSFADRPPNGIEQIMPKWDPKSTYSLAKLLIEMCNYEIKSVAEKEGARPQRPKSPKVSDKEKERYKEDVYKYQQQLTKGWESVLEIRAVIDAYVSKEYFHKHPLKNSLNHTQAFITTLMAEWLRPFRPVPGKKSPNNSSPDNDLHESWLVFAKKMVKAYNYFPEESLDFEMHMALRTDDGDKFLLALVQAAMPTKPEQRWNLSDNFCRDWDNFYRDWKEAMKSAQEPAQEPSKDRRGGVKHLMKGLATRVRDKASEREDKAPSKEEASKTPSKGKASKASKKEKTEAPKREDKAPSKGDTSKTPSKGDTSKASRKEKTEAPKREEEREKPRKEESNKEKPKSIEESSKSARESSKLTGGSSKSAGGTSGGKRRV